MAYSESKRTMKIADVLKIKSFSDPRISPDGSRVVVVVETKDLETNKRLKDIWLVPTDGREPINLTNDGQSISPRWAPDGKKIVFLSSQGRKRSMWIMDVEQKNKQYLTEFYVSNTSLGITGENLAWSPDSTKIAFVASMETSNSKRAIRIYNKATYRAQKGFSDMMRRHIWIVSPLGYSQPQQLTFGDQDEHSISWSPNSEEIAFVSDRTGENEWTFHTDLWAVSLKTLEIRQITNTLSAEFQSTWSPDGKKIAYGSFTRNDMCNDSNPEDMHVWIINSDGTDAKDYTSQLDRRCSTPKWSLDGKEIFFTAEDHGRKNIYSITFQDDIKSVTQGNRTITGMDVAIKSDKITYISHHVTQPGELFVAKLDGSEERKLTHFNDSVINNIHLSEAEEFVFNSFDNKIIQGWIMKPSNFHPAKKYPFALHVHGGPHSMVGHAFKEIFQLIVSHGYILAYINVRGSSGYGQAFSDGCVKDMGGGDYNDYMKGVDHLLSTHEYIDPDRMGVWGGSYGGYMTNWIITHTDRFKAAISLYPITNMITMFTTNAPSWVDIEFGGPLWDKMDLILKCSPIMYVKHAKTPTLFLQGELDSICPLVESEQMFMALRKLKIDSEMVIYSEEGHGIRDKPLNYLDSYRRIIAWLNKYLKKKN
ncbi:MAG: S9 family peptidase [Candidatus Bathyarchaeota archaeon]|nr:MAG: S9 family peptidase [Candidatus Bathyarchaeota archaeon]